MVERKNDENCCLLCLQGTVYVKCHSKEEACDIRESLHGTWFNGKSRCHTEYFFDEGIDGMIIAIACCMPHSRIQVCTIVTNLFY